MDLPFRFETLCLQVLKLQVVLPIRCRSRRNKLKRSASAFCMEAVSVYITIEPTLVEVCTTNLPGYTITNLLHTTLSMEETCNNFFIWNLFLFLTQAKKPFNAQRKKLVYRPPAGLVRNSFLHKGEKLVHRLSCLVR